MKNEPKYEIKVTLRDGSRYNYKTTHSWEIDADKLNDTRKQFCNFDDGRFIVAREAILSVETREIVTDGEKVANNEA